MIDLDAVITAELKRMLPVTAEPDWEAVAGAAGLGRRRRLPGVLAVVAVVVAAAVLSLVAPWDRSGGSLADRALAAVGSQPVVHVLAEFPTGERVVEIATGASRPVVQVQEVWYDADRGLKKTVTRVGSAVLGVTLETPKGGVTAHGIVYDCAWIAAHPVEATRAHVSCNASGENGTTPRVIPRPKPTLDPGLAGFVDGYRQALAAGQAREAGSGEADGAEVDWLVFRTRDGSERVALDAETHKPVLLVGDHGLRVRITTIDTIAFDALDFGRPRPEEVPLGPSFGRAEDGGELPLEAGAIAAAMPDAVWAGTTLNGLPLVRAERQALRASFFAGAKPTLTGTGLELDYGSLDARGRLDWSKPHVRISEAPSRDLGFANKWGFTQGDDPAAGQLLLQASSGDDGQSFGPDGKPLPPGPPFALGFAVVDGVYVTIETTTPDLVVATARELVSPLRPSTG